MYQCSNDKIQKMVFTSIWIIIVYGAALAMVSRDVFGADVQPDGTIRLTLLRSPVYAHHDPFVVVPEDPYPVCDQGEHEYRISLMPMAKIDGEAIDAEVRLQTQPVWFSETTCGCKGEIH